MVGGSGWMRLTMVFAAAVVGVAGCASDEAADQQPVVTVTPTSTAAPDLGASTTVDEPPTTAPVLGTPTLEELPTIQPVERFTVESDEQPVFVDESGLWFMGRGLTDDGDGWRIWPTDGTYSQSDAILLPVESTNSNEAILVEGVMWVPAINATTSDGATVENAMLRFDVVTRMADVFDAPGPLYRLHADTSTVWAEVLGSEGRTLVGYDAGGSVGAPMTVADAPDDDAFVAILLPTRSGVYDCLGGSWGFTPAGGKRSELSIPSSGCNAVAVDAGYVLGVPNGLMLLGNDGSVSEIALPPELTDRGNVELVCDAPAQRGDVVVALCGRIGDVLFALRIDLGAMSATFEPAIDADDLGTRRMANVLGADGRFGAIDIERDLTTTGAAVGDLSQAGELEWSKVDLASVGEGSKQFQTYGDALWISRHIGEPGEPLDTWYEVVTTD